MGSLLQALYGRVLESVSWDGRWADLHGCCWRSGEVQREVGQRLAAVGSRETTKPEIGGPVPQANGPSPGPFRRRMSPS